ncbi:MAG TPA: IPT/TIG domain-containing protein [Candidatus Acidoferrum sp.]|nr:IPT/TIG domain-containing protein [Candidatus Acidoferrum sp.]
MKFGFGPSTEKNGTPRIERIAPAAALPGGEVALIGSGFASRGASKPVVRFGEAESGLSLVSANRVVVRVPDGANGGLVSIESGGHRSQPFSVSVAMQIADNLQPVTNPAVDFEGNTYVTFSGPRGQRVPVSLYKVTANFNVKPFVTSLMNPSGLALDRAGNLFVSCRNDGTVHRVTPDGRSEEWIEGMGIATGVAFDKDENLYVGDRSGTIFKINPGREIFVFATLEPSVAAYHLAFHPDGELYATGPTTSSFDHLYRISKNGEVTTFFRGLGRPQGLAFDKDANLYVAASYGGRRGIVRISPQGRAELVLSGSQIVGMALLPTGRAMIATVNALFTIDWDVRGLPLLG